MNSNDSDKVIYDRTKLKEFAARGGLLNMVFNMLPRGIMQDGEVERLCKRIYTRIRYTPIWTLWAKYCHAM